MDLFNNRGIAAFSLLCASPPVGESKLFNQEIEAKYGRLLAGREGRSSNIKKGSDSKMRRDIFEQVEDDPEGGNICKAF